MTEEYSLLATVRHALKGERHDYTAAPLNRAVILLAVPMVLEMAMESLFSLADVFWVSHLGREAIAVIGLTESILSLIYAVGIGMGFAATAIVSRRIGEKDPERASRSAGQIILLGLMVSIAIGAALGSFAPEILAGMGADHAILVTGSAYARLMLGGNLTVFLIFLINAIFRGAGDAVIAMRTLWLANALNILLGPCFIFGLGPFPRLGVTGAAVATNLGRGIGVLYQLWQLSGRNGRVRLRARHFRLDREIMASILRPAWNGMAQLLISMTSWVGLYKILALFGSSALAGYTVAIRIIMAVLMPTWGLANAGATLVGQNLGAGRPDRSEAAVRVAARFSVLLLGGIAVVFIAAAPFIVRLFASDAAVLQSGTRALWIVSLGLPLYAVGMCMEGAFNGAGDTWTPTRLNFYCLWLGQVPLAWLLSQPLGLGATGVYIAVPVSFSALALSGVWFFKRGAWKKQRI